MVISDVLHRCLHQPKIFMLVLLPPPLPLALLLLLLLFVVEVTVVAVKAVVPKADKQEGRKEEGDTTRIESLIWKGDCVIDRSSTN